MKYYQITNKKTSKPAGNSTGWQMYDKEIKEFGTIEELKSYINEYYSGCKRVKMYEDGANNEPIHCGYIYSFKNYDYEDGKRCYFFEAHWLEVREIEAKNIIIK